MSFNQLRTPIDYLLSITRARLNRVSQEEMYQIIWLFHELEDFGAEFSKSFRTYKISLGFARPYNIFDLQESESYHLVSLLS